MKNLTLLLALLLTGFLTQAQVGLSLSYQFGMPGKQGYSSDMKISVVGAQAKLSYAYDDYLHLTAGAGYFIVPFDKLNVGGVQKKVTGVNLQVIPITVGGEFFLLDKKIKPFIGFEFGWALTRQTKSDYSDAINRNNVILIPQAGVAYEINDNLNFFASVKENVIIYQYRDFKNHNEVFLLTGINAGITLRF